MSKNTSDYLKKFHHALSHDLKQPLGLIRAYTYYIRKSKIDNTDELTEYTDKIDDQVDSLTEMIDLLALEYALSSKIVQLSIKETNLIEVVDAAKTDLLDTFSDRSISVTYAANLPQIAVDILYLQKAVTLVIKNALENTTNVTPISVTVSSDNKVVSIIIEDSGNGIPDEELESIMLSFTKGSNKSSGRTKKLGLGLAVAKQILELHEGTLSLQKNEPTGIRVTLQLPLSK